MNKPIFKGNIFMVLPLRGFQYSVIAALITASLYTIPQSAAFTATVRNTTVTDEIVDGNQLVMDGTVERTIITQNGFQTIVALVSS
ncbi:hypothetical protein [Escherichia coli]|uniref:hypothetical protein n=1 Tax=Escherichia coli TaxID=562 RepID=UPI00117BA763|nr:hypothetical protein [Escherichia coli]MXF12928.1 hypothetical protein [Escherichia coli]